MNTVILLTGATGFLGTWIAKELLPLEGLDVIVLVHSKDLISAFLRLKRAWWEWPEMTKAIGEKVSVLSGDVTLPLLGLDDTDYRQLTQKVTHIIHTAADLRIDGPYRELHRTNVKGTENLLELAREAHLHHGLSRFSHVSTAYVAGRRKGAIHEESLTDEWGFTNVYELTKYKGECVVRSAGDQLPITILRPGMIIGDSKTGAVKTFNTLYYPLKLYLTGRLHVVPARRSLSVNFVPVDYVAKAAVRLTFKPEACGKTFHLTVSREFLPTAGDILDFVSGWARGKLGLTLRRTLFIPVPRILTRKKYRIQGSSHNMTTRSSRRRSTIGTVMELLPYFTEDRSFLRENTDRILGCYPMDWKRVLPPVLEYAVRYSFLHRSERNVYEQVLFRLKSRRRPVRYYDITQGEIVKVRASDIEIEIQKAANALLTLGISKGDRVALVGLNSCRYLVLDIAIGLTGAVSVPLYYTSPPAEIIGIIRVSGAQLLFIGTPGLLEPLQELSSALTIVYFYREPLPQRLRPNVLLWHDFLLLGSNKQCIERSPVGFSDIASLRYTSGTTGNPKGAVFTHGNIRWMAQTMISLLPWKERNVEGTYLSFLPMSHVVEGILGTYSPYYLPASVNIFFLEGFNELVSALRRVKPTIFFSVPRFYEKVWERFMEKKIGRYYMGLEGGIIKSILGPVLRRSVLKRAGLQRCAQLIVGSARSGDALLHGYRNLGIEVHNAYGLTEAPLVTLNRIHTNRLGTVGEPLPDTLIRIEDDGEVMVKGPQVTAGYYGCGTEQPFRDGWLFTGDLGHITKEGSLVIHGRKKEIIVTSYGKNLYPAKIEAMLKEIPGISEAVLIGERKPYCSALLWVKEGCFSQDIIGEIERQILQVNARLSHPEQVKGWALLKNDLTIEGGDLTANLKIKRDAVLKRRQGIIDALYRKSSSEKSGLKSVIHIGGMSQV